MPEQSFNSYEETEQEIILRFQIPEAVKEHLIVKVFDDKMSIQMDKKNFISSNEGNFVKEEEVFSSLSKEIQLPSKVQPNKTKTGYKNGLFEVIMKKA
jgi:HSP20 family molecular chaperone IbpA